MLPHHLPRRWFHTHGMASAHNKWMVQIPRAFPGMNVPSFQTVLDNLFLPLWEVSIDPRTDPILGPPPPPTLPPSAAADVVVHIELRPHPWSAPHSLITDVVG